MPAKKGTGYPGRVVRKCVVELEENQGEKVKLLSFFSSSSSSPPEGRAATVFCPRGRYSNKSCMERVNETLLLKSRIRKTNVRMVSIHPKKFHRPKKFQAHLTQARTHTYTQGHGRAIQSGKASTPSVTPGCKRMVVRASFLCMLNSSFRGKGSPVTAISTNEGGTTFQIDNPMQVLAITLGCCKAFSSDLEGQHALWEEYTARMLEIASRRLQCTRLSQEDMRIWRSFQKMLRSAEVCPARMAEVGDMGRGKKVKRSAIHSSMESLFL